MNILIVEDDARVADFLERGLKAEGYRIRVAATGPDGLEACRSLWEDQQQTGVAGSSSLISCCPA